MTLVEFLQKIDHNDPVLESTSLLLKKSVRKSSDPIAAAEALLNCKSLDISADPFFPKPMKICLESIAKYLPQLEELNVSGNELYSLHGLEKSLSLKAFYAQKCNLKDGAFLVQFAKSRMSSTTPNLVSLKIGENTFDFTDFLNELALPQLKTLDVSKLHLRSLDFVVNFPLLEELTASSNDIENIHQISQLTELKRLSLAQNMIEDLQPLSKLRKLRYLDVSGNRIVDLDGVRDCYQLCELKIGHNKIRSLKPLKDLRDLFRVGLSGNPLWEDDFDIVPRSIRLD
jgi:internalin A